MLWQGAQGQSPHNRCFKSMSFFIMTTTAFEQEGCHLFLYLFVGDVQYIIFFNWKPFSHGYKQFIFLEFINSVIWGNALQVT